MSRETLDVIEKAIAAHFKATTTDDDSEERHGAIIVNWVVGYTISNIVDVGEEHGGRVLGFANDYACADTDPNAAVGLVSWMADKLPTDMFDYTEDDE